jgi:Na+/melibiose symporter-like transporter
VWGSKPTHNDYQVNRMLVGLLSLIVSIVLHKEKSVFNGKKETGGRYIGCCFFVVLYCFFMYSSFGVERRVEKRKQWLSCSIWCLVDVV